MSSSTPIIAITAGRLNLPISNRNDIQNVWSGCNVNYLHSVIRAGGCPVLLPYLAGEDAIDSLMERVDGLLLSGGGDVHSLRYGQEPHAESAGQDALRDDMEERAFEVAVRRGIPVLGICRGIQSLNVAMGGTLVQNIPTQIANAVKHYASGYAPVLLHSVKVSPGSLLERVVGCEMNAVNSWHHQSVDRVADGLTVNAVAPDGVIEGLEAADGRPILAVQFHPEELSHEVAAFQRLFDWLCKPAG